MNREIFEKLIFNQEEYNEQMEYWLKLIGEELQPTELPIDFARQNLHGSDYDSVKIEFSSHLSGKLINFFKKNSDITLHVFLLSAFKVFLFKHTQSKETLVVSPLLNIDDESDNPMKYNKRIFFRDTVDTNLTFNELLIATRNTTLASYKNQEFPLELAFKKVGLDIKGFPFLDRIIFLLKNLHDEKDIIDLKYDLLFSLIRQGKHLEGDIYYNKRLFRIGTINEFSERYTRILESCVQDVYIRIKDLEILSEREVKQLLFDFNKTESVYPGERTIQDLFEEQVERTPHRIALEMDQSISFKELNERANRLARLLRKKGVSGDHIVGIILEPSLAMIIGILGVLKAGGAYVPINPAYPEKRIHALLNESNVSIVLTEEKITRNFSFMFLQDTGKRQIKLLVTGPRPLVEDLDQLQVPDRSYIDYEKYSPFIGQSMIKNSITFHFSRGCMYKCAYCFKIWPNDRYVHRSAENMFEELLLYYKMGVRKFSFVDDLPNFNIKESAKFYRLIIKNRLKVQLFYPNGLRGDLLNRDYIDLMIEAGTVSLDVALETTSPRLQKLVGKNLNLERLHKNILYMIEKHPQLILESQLLHGIPTETEAEARHSLDYLKSLKWVHFPYLHVLKIYPNTDMARLAIEHGTSADAIEASDNLGYNEIPGTLPFAKDFTRQYQAEFANEYFMSRERLLAVLPYQIKSLSEDELVQKYNSFLPVAINSFTDLLSYAGIKPGELKADFLPDDYGKAAGLNGKIREHFPPKKPRPGALKLLLLDVSAYFSHDRHQVIYDVLEPPLGLLYLQTHLDRVFAGKIKGKIISSRIDFDSFRELRRIIDDFKPDVIGVRTLNFFKDFFHQTIALIRQWGIDTPIIAGGPYATSSYQTMLRDTNIDLAVLGEGEITFEEIIGKIIENKGVLPQQEILKRIPGIAFIENREKLMQKRSNREILFMDNLSRVLALESPGNLKPVNRPGDLAYIIYTSGSTGTPRGVMIRHNNLVNQVTGLEKTFDFDISDHYILLAAFTFDVSVMHIFLPLTTGARLFLISDETKRDPLKLWQFIYEKKINILNIVPAFMKALLENIEKKKFYFKYLFVGGDVFDRGLYNRLKETFKIDGLVNIYGPTETTINALLYQCKHDDRANGAPIPIGKPLQNYKVYILAADFSLVPIGVVGELFISGEGVARGYLNNPELTSEKFCLRRPGALFEKTAPGPRKNFLLKGSHKDHMQSCNHASMQLSPIYRTGDLARWCRDGNIEFWGRIDQQVKIRGFRIEPGEIEKHLLNHNKIINAVVVAKRDEGGEKSLCAYVIYKGHEPAKSSFEKDAARELKELLSGKLPDYMIPNHFVKLEQMPLTISGKVDAKALPDPRKKTGNTYVPPGNEMEKRLEELWAEVLGINKNIIGIDSNFFTLGGHSLTATILISKIHKKLEVRVPVVELFKTPTIRELSHYITRLTREKHADIRTVEKKEYYELSSAQKRLYIIQQMDLNSTAYNISEVISWECGTDTEQLQAVFKKLIKRHEAFRTSFKVINGSPRQVIHDAVDFKIQYDDAGSGVQGEEYCAGIIEDFIRPFDLSCAPLLRVGLVQFDEKKHILMVDMHHIISDAVSQKILIEDFKKLSGGEELAAARLQYKDFSQWQNRLFNSEEIKNQEKYWLNVFFGKLPRLNMPLDYPRTNVKTFKGAILNFQINSQLTRQLRQLTNETETTLFMVLLAAYNVMVSKYTAQYDIIIGTPTAGRRHADLENVVGMFANTLALRNYPRGNLTFGKFLENVKENALNAFENQDYPFEMLVEKLGLKREGGRNPLFDMVFNFVSDYSEDENEKESAKSPLELSVASYIQTATFDISLRCIEKKDVILFALNYRTPLFRKETAQRLSHHFINILKKIVENPGVYLTDIDMLGKQEKERVVLEFNRLNQEDNYEFE